VFKPLDKEKIEERLKKLAEISKTSKSIINRAVALTEVAAAGMRKVGQEADPAKGKTEQQKIDYDQLLNSVVSYGEIPYTKEPETGMTDAE